MTFLVSNWESESEPEADCQTEGQQEPTSPVAGTKRKREDAEEESEQEEKEDTQPLAKKARRSYIPGMLMGLWRWLTRQTEQEESEEEEEGEGEEQQPEAEPEPTPYTGRDGLLCLMRHSTRQDVNGFEAAPLDQWPDKMHRPYDPPISDYDLPAEAGLKLKKYNFQAIVSSPYRRCLETAGIVARTIGVDVVHVDDRLGEWCVEVARCCRGAGLNEMPMERLSEEEAEKELGGGGVRLGEWNKVDIGLADAAGLMDRVHGAVADITQTHGPTNVLLVSHGDIANRWLPEAEYIEEYSYIKLNESGFVVLKSNEAGTRPTVLDIVESHLTEEM
eukprot:TRINITY_DN586_c0_g1_i1.p1 TRINITY_DN586_c0_g1~~TRINITY_DN586_c0_g1_i1.p1  ORF type:complete len:333 (+),score=75.12 TRINITY_DN586_c0_g1_i1:66-1064(+)